MAGFGAFATWLERAYPPRRTPGLVVYRLTLPCSDHESANAGQASAMRCKPPVAGISGEDMRAANFIVTPVYPSSDRYVNRKI